MHASHLVLASALLLGCSVSGDPSTFDEPVGGNDGGAGGSDDVTVSGGASGGPSPDAEAEVIIGPGAPADAAGKFTGPEVTESSAIPTFAYPEDGVLLPPNINSIEVHYRPANGQSLFELAFTGPGTNLIVYLGCEALNGGCVFRPDDELWSKLANGARGAGPITYRIRGMDANAAGSAIGVSEPQTLEFASGDIIGGLYYWNDVGSIDRFEFGVSGKTAEMFINGAMAGAVCVGCHSLSRDGKYMAAGMNIPFNTPMRVYDVANRTPMMVGGVPVEGAGDFATFSPDSSKLVASVGDAVNWVDLNTGVVLPTIGKGAMPDWSADGKWLVTALGQVMPVAVAEVTGAILEVRSYDAANVSWGAPRMIASGANNYYPAFAPSSDWVLYNHSPSNQSSFDNTSDGELRVVDATVPGANHVAIDRATAGLPCSWPKWAPVVDTYDGRTVMWFTVATQRGYGLYGTNHTQLWMAGFDPARAAAGQDPSFPAFWLPFQDINTGNRIAQWVASIERPGCEETGECESGYVCKDGRCVPDLR